MPSYSFVARDDGPDRVVHPGGCYLRNELVHCALEASRCSSGLDYRSPLRLAEQGEDRCRTGWTTAPGLVGMCTSPLDGYRCTGHASNCLVPEAFVPDLPYCSLRHNHFPHSDTSLALYGSCTESVSHGIAADTCVWAEQDCPGTGHTASGDCPCDTVRTGACVRPSETTPSWNCAVSEDACDGDAVFYHWIKVVLEGKDCRLCPRSGADPASVSKGKLDPPSWWYDGNSLANNSSETSAQDLKPSPDSSCPVGIVAGGAVYGILAALWLTLVVQYRSFLRRGSSNTANMGGNLEDAPSVSVT